MTKLPDLTVLVPREVQAQTFIIFELFVHFIIAIFGSGIHIYNADMYPDLQGL